MLVYVGKRCVQTVPVVFGVVTVVFMLIRWLPGDPAAFMLGENAQQPAIDALRAELGLDEPLATQYRDFITGLVQFDIGESILSKKPVIDLVLHALPTTLFIGGTSVVLGFIVGIPVGAIAAFWGSRGKAWPDQGLTGAVLAIDTAPGFWLALLLMLAFTLKLGWLPATGAMEWSDPVALARRAALPVAVLSLTQVGTIARITRTSVLEVLGDDYVRTARAMGTPELAVLFRHALRNAALPVVTVAGLSFGRLLGGTVITESIFALPGMGTVLVNAIFGRDYPVVQGVVLIYATLFILINLATDIAYTRLDPRVKL